MDLVDFESDTWNCLANLWSSLPFDREFTLPYHYALQLHVAQVLLALRLVKAIFLPVVWLLVATGVRPIHESLIVAISMH